MMWNNAQSAFCVSGIKLDKVLAAPIIRQGEELRRVLIAFVIRMLILAD
jgi:hypothetical protein